jgi:hypothetical protein
MDAFFNTLKKGLVAMLFIVVGFSMTYIPQLPSSHVDTVEANGATGGATLPMQVVQNASALAGNALASITSIATGSLSLKENVLDGIGWAIAKRIVSGMVRSLINWVNSGFQGSPAFITDLKGFLLNIADEEFGRVIDEMGGLGSFICSPFRLDVQVSLETQYAQSRATGQSAPTCTVSGIMDNIQGFISGIDSGNGLSDWLEITSTPQTNTPYGAVLNAEVAARARLINAEGQVLTEANWGDGFLSQKICESVGGDSGGQQCTISKPGRVIADQLNKALGAGQDTLVQADEINELIAALLGQLANKALTGINGLLGLSGGTGFTESGYDGSYLDQLVDESDALLTDISDEGIDTVIVPQLKRQIEYREVIVAYQTEFQTFLDQPLPELTESGENVSATNQSTYSQLLVYRQNVQNELANLNDQLAQTNQDILSMINLAYRYDQADADQKIEVQLEFTNLPILTDYEVEADRSRISDFASDNTVPNPTITRTVSLTALLNDIDPTVTVDPEDPSWVNLANSLDLPIQ